MPPSSHELVIEQVVELLEDRRRELNEGIAPRALARRIDGVDERFRDFDRRLHEVESAIRERRAVSDFRMETGRHQIVHPTDHGYALPVPPAPLLPKPSKRPFSVFLKTAVKGPLASWTGVVVIVVVSHLLARCGIQAPPAPVAPAPAVSH